MYTKKIKIHSLIIFLIIVLTFKCFSQNASTYFPSTTGYKWYFKNTPLDTNNNPITGLITYRIDSFAVVSNYQGLLASIVLTKDNLINLNQNTPYTDSSFYNFQSTNTWCYFQPSQLPDTLISQIGILNFINSLKAWYNYYRFAQAVNSQYTIFTKDTTIGIDTLTIPLRISLKGKRMNDETVNTVNGPYNCKKFVLTAGISYLIILPPPLPAIEVPLLQRPDTIWVAQNVWMVKESIPSVSISLSQIGININIPITGKIVELVNPSINIKKISSEVPDNFILKQNYPNPFNHSTIINYSIPKSGFVQLILYDALGREIVKLINEYQDIGEYQLNFEANNLSSGIYYYKLLLDNYSEVKKLVITR
ncbi:MAG: T9SS type A sorting domain-containing protein [Ignavibacteria bacterium]|nr:T9SS type A sorting domain-containing protein [Ignavibacteria bacterium]